MVRNNTKPVSSEDISEAGCYVCNWNGHLLRLAYSSAGTPVVSIISSRELSLTKLSDNPFIPLSEAKSLAATARGTGSRARTNGASTTKRITRRKTKATTRSAGGRRRSTRTSKKKRTTSTRASSRRPKKRTTAKRR